MGVEGGQGEGVEEGELVVGELVGKGVEREGSDEEREKRRRRRGTHAHAHTRNYSTQEPHT